MDKIYKIYDFTQDSFIHGTIEKFEYDLNAKEFKVIFSYLNLKQGGCLYECTITITDWWDFEVIEKGTDVNVRYKLEEIPIEIDQIFRYEYDGTTLVFIAMGYLSIDAVVSYKFTKPKIHITGQYDPD